MSRLLAAAAIFLVGSAGPMRAQERSAARRSPVAGSMVYHALLYDHPYGDERSRSWGARFAGRLALRLHDQAYVGFAVGSWQDAWGECGAGSVCALGLERSAVASQLYVQVYPINAAPLFIRTGGGMGQTHTLLPAQSYIYAADHIRLLWSVGVGLDWPLGRQLHFTPSVDYHVMPAVPRASPELRSAVAIGLGLSLR